MLQNYTVMDKILQIKPEPFMLRIFFLITLFFTPLFAETDAMKNWEAENKEVEQVQDLGMQEAWTKSLTYLIALMALLFIATWFLKRMDFFKVKSMQEASRITILEKKVLSPKSMLYLLDIDGKKITVSESQTNGVELLYVWPSKILESGEKKT